MIINQIISPSNKSEFERYYYFRWEYLRKELNQKLGSERDDLEDSSFHRMIINNNLKRKIIGVGRLHQNSLDTFQVRYFAIHKDFRRKGLGAYLMNHLEKIAIEKTRHYKPSELYILLNARENALNFYKKLNYKNIKKTNLLFGIIQHYEMRKKII
tara:strand:+ start:602 stop:1069 length:468 start_codon:yes stop_codon:yes gene_type:complete